MASSALAKLLVRGGALAALAGVLLLMPGERSNSVEAAANPLPPLIACSNIDGSADNKVSVADILYVVTHYETSYGQPGYAFLWDPVSPYNITNPVGTGSITVADILYVVNRFGTTCPLVDTQIAQATLWLLNGHPELLTEDPDALAALGYIRAAQDLPGDGMRYVNPYMLDGLFDPAEPEGLDYNDGELVSYVYYADGDAVGWSDVPEHSNNVNIDTFCTPVPPDTACSFSGTEDGWHDHVWLCIWNVGTPSATVYAPLSQSDCESSGGIWDPRNGWMLHIHNHLPNPNGRFANCIPDVEGWGPYNCPQ